MGWYPKNAPQGAVITVGAEAGTDIPVAIQLQDSGEQDLAVSGVVAAFLSDAASGLDVAAAGPDGGLAIGTDGDVLVELVADIMWVLQSEADGDVDVVLTDSGAFGPVYLVVVLPDGSQVVSDAITFT